MKQFLLVVVMLAAVYSLSAQEPVVTTPTTTTTTKVSVDNNAQVPASIRMDFQLHHPSATNVTWMPMNDWWYASYKNEDNRMERVYYNTQPYYLERNENFRLSLPVLNTFVPDDVIANAVSTYGNELFSITASKLGETGQTYHVTLIRNGVSEIVSMNASAVAYSNSNINKMKP
jgi:hypothetical protein